MNDALAVVLPLAFVVLVLWRVVWHMRRKSSALPADSGLKGVGGWLAFYIWMSSIVGPLMTAAKLAKELDKVVADTPAVQTLPEWSTYVTTEWTVVALFVAWLWWVNYGLATRFVPASVRRVKVLLVVAPLLMAATEIGVGFILFGVNASADVVLGLGSQLLSTLVWYTYFSRSKRVRATYYGDEAASSTSAAPAPMAAIPPAPALPAAATHPVPAHPIASPLEQKLIELARLLERGLVSQADYDAKKAELLGTL